MAKNTAFCDYILELMGPLDGVRLRSMFGGQGLFQGDVMFGLIAGDTLYLKVDEQNRGFFEEAGMAPFAYSRRDKAIAMSYFEAPPESLEDGDLFLPWVESAIAAARRRHKPKRRGTSRNVMGD
ncbi:MAG: TfoX/Sxy family protein [Alphaproteobacteria bacterium]